MLLLRIITVLVIYLGILHPCFAISSTTTKLEKSLLLTIPMGKNGDYITELKINNQAIKGLIDTGASTMAINSQQATMLGLKYIDAPQVLVETASGLTKGYQIVIDNIELAGIKINNITATIIEGEWPNIALIGTNYLKYFDISLQQNKLLIFSNKKIKKSIYGY